MPLLFSHKYYPSCNAFSAPEVVVFEVDNAACGRGDELEGALGEIAALKTLLAAVVSVLSDEDQKRVIGAAGILWEASDA